MSHPKSKAYREWRKGLAPAFRTGKPIYSGKDAALDALERALDTTFSKHGQRRKQY